MFRLAAFQAPSPRACVCGGALGSKLYECTVNPPRKHRFAYERYGLILREHHIIHAGFPFRFAPTEPLKATEGECHTSSGFCWVAEGEAC
jgi:hypothetical protein